MTTEIQELSEKLAKLYGVDAYTVIPIKYRADTNRWIESTRKFYLAEDSGRIAELADDNGVDVKFYPHSVLAGNLVSEIYLSYPTRHDAARMARVRCLISIGENK